MPLTRKVRSLIRRLCRELNRNKVDFLARRADLKTRIGQLQERGKIAIVYSGIDCDGGRWDNRVSEVAAIPVAVERWYDRYEAQAEGPQWQTLEKPSVAADLVEDDRDLAMEAFEDGHSHVLWNCRKPIGNWIWHTPLASSGGVRCSRAAILIVR
jgi:hypothetical protein